MLEVNSADRMIGATIGMLESDNGEDYSDDEKGELRDFGRELMRQLAAQTHVNRAAILATVAPKKAKE